MLAAYKRPPAVPRRRCDTISLEGTANGLTRQPSTPRSPPHHLGRAATIRDRPKGLQYNDSHRKKERANPPPNRLGNRSPPVHQPAPPPERPNRSAVALSAGLPQHEHLSALEGFAHGLRLRTGHGRVRWSVRSADETLHLQAPFA